MALNKSYTGRMAGTGAGGKYQEYGVGNSPSPTHQATRVGRFPDDNTGGGRSQGETPGSGSIYAAVLNERPNISNPRNRGPMRAPSRMGRTPVAATTMTSRKTGRVRA